MTQQNHNDLWRDFPKTAQEFEARFATEDDCRAYWIEARWGGKPACARCSSTRVWSERDGFLFECADCGHQTSLTSGTLLEKTRKPFKTWFRAVFEISTRRTGISGKDLQRIWVRLLQDGVVLAAQAARGDGALKQRSARPFRATRRSPRRGKGGPHKELVLVAAEANGRVRLAHVDNNDAGTLQRFADGQIAADTGIVTDGHAGYNEKSLGKRTHDAVVQTKTERRENDAVQGCHWTISLLKRWLVGTHAGAVRDKHLQAYLDEFAFRHNRRKTNGVGRIAARVIESLVARPPMTMRQLIDSTRRCRWFGSHQIAAA